MNAYIYIEGGAKGAYSKNLNTRCQEAFHKLLGRMGFKGRKPRLVACGGRDDVYNRFVIEHSQKFADYVAMWIEVKSRWGLTIDAAERSTLIDLVSECPTTTAELVVAD